MHYSTSKLNPQRSALSQAGQALFRSLFIIQPSFSVPVSVTGNNKGNNSSNEENTSIRRNNRVECDKPKAKCREDFKLEFSNKVHEFRSGVLFTLLTARSGDT